MNEQKILNQLAEEVRLTTKALVEKTSLWQQAEANLQAAKQERDQAEHDVNVAKVSLFNFLTKQVKANIDKE